MRSHYLQKKLTSLCIMASIFFHVSNYGYDQLFLSHVTQSNIHSLSSMHQKTHDNTTQQDTSLSSIIHSLQTARQLKLSPMSLLQKRTLVFEHISTLLNKHDTIIDQNLVDKMYLVRGTSSHPTNHLISHLITNSNGTVTLKTEIGVKRFVEIISQPTTNIQELLNRQQIIKTLIDNETLCTTCNQLLDHIQQAEKYFFEIYNKNGMEPYEKGFFKFQPFFEKFGFSKTKALTINTRSIQFMHAIASISVAIFAGITLSDFHERIFLKSKNIRSHKPESLWKSLQKIRKIGLDAAYIVSVPFQIILGIHALKLNIDTLLNMQEILIGFASYIRNTTALCTLMQTNKIINPMLPQLQEVLYSLQSTSKEFNELNKLLTGKTFDLKNPSLFASPGDILAAYQYLTQPSIREKFDMLINLMGEIDVYVALAEIIKTYQYNPFNSCAQFCFAQFKEYASTPMISAINFWNPFIECSKVVCNDMHLNEGHERNIILTGANTGGKSTIMKAIVISTLLAQTFGIAPAESFTITPFSKIITYMNIDDDVSMGLSLFAAEVHKARDIFQTIQLLPENENALIVIDEMFTGTSPDKAEKLSYSFLQTLNTYKNALFITATHFKKLIELEKETAHEIKNYHMGVELDANSEKVIKYTYKLIPGPSPVVNADQIAEEILMPWKRYFKKQQ